MFPHPVTGELTEGIAKVRYSHDAMIDLMIAQPSLKQNDLAAMFDRSPAWISNVVNSDAFQARYHERREELIDPEIMFSIKERINAVASVSLQKVLEKLSNGLPVSDDFALRSAKLATDALGYGSRAPQVTTNVAVVVQVPQKIQSASEWAARHSPASAA
jgi:hypothetical protein